MFCYRVLPAAVNRSLPETCYANRPSQPWRRDFQSIVVALLLLERGTDGKYPVRPDFVLPIAEYTRRAVITGATAREISIVLTNSDGDPGRRRSLLERLGPGATERIVDPGQAVVEARLSDAETGELSNECGRAVNRWYGRVGR